MQSPEGQRALLIELYGPRRRQGGLRLAALEEALDCLHQDTVASDAGLQSRGHLDRQLGQTGIGHGEHQGNREELPQAPAFHRFGHSHGLENEIACCRRLALASQCKSQLTQRVDPPFVSLDRTRHVDDRLEILSRSQAQGHQFQHTVALLAGLQAAKRILGGGNIADLGLAFRQGGQCTFAPMLILDLLGRLQGLVVLSRQGLDQDDEMQNIDPFVLGHLAEGKRKSRPEVPGFGIGLGDGGEGRRAIHRDMDGLRSDARARPVAAGRLLQGNQHPGMVLSPRLDDAARSAALPPDDRRGRTRQPVSAAASPRRAYR